MLSVKWNERVTMKTSKHIKTSKYLLANHRTIEMIDSNPNDCSLLLFIPGEGRQYFPKPFPRKGRRLRSWLNVIKNMIPIMKIRFFQ